MPCRYASNAVEWIGRIERHLDNRITGLDQHIADRLDFIGTDAPQVAINAQCVTGVASSGSRDMGFLLDRGNTGDERGMAIDQHGLRADTRDGEIV